MTNKPAEQNDVMACDTQEFAPSAVENNPVYQMGCQAAIASVQPRIDALNKRIMELEGKC